MGAVLFQLPPNFKANLDRFASFLKQAAPANTGSLRIAFEFRHASWFAGDVFNLLRAGQRWAVAVETALAVMMDVGFDAALSGDTIVETGE
jgi:uncharacterized protein YecE (DUF72 family)